MRSSTRAIGFGILVTALFGTSTIATSVDGTALTLDAASGPPADAPVASSVMVAGLMGAPVAKDSLGDLAVVESRGGATE
ncbi:hypothetical protein [Demequina muriae]|uniref:Uncharacterized protein n=1 Tax=Demequina muriae TaxID=3051664 RepID=A0ABT8GG12_9MICO|nr:hypothetical protein [Demequina sp. EGI L300058]MDN4480184.1 hypothetical protein [Demequina sp. EGI L300058]